MSSTIVAPEIRNFAVPSAPEAPLNPRTIEFGRMFSPNQFVMQYKDGAWGNARIERVHTLEMHPASIALHYAQEIFEGLKAYLHADGRIVLFRPEMNARRMIRSAERMAMPPVDEDLFLRALTELVTTEKNWVPGAPGCYYLRPVMFATEACIGVHAGNEFRFYVLGLPSGSYFREVPSGLGAVDVLISQNVARAAEGGTGNVKCGGNYAVTLKITTEAKRLGCAQVLFLDAVSKSRIEEMGGMNIMFVRNGTLITPSLTGTILPGVTRDSILKLAPALGIPASEETIHLREIAEGIRSGEVTEAIACGTAAVLTGIRSFRMEDGTYLRLPEAPGPVTTKLYDRLSGIQFGRYPDEYGWLTTVCRL